jgi:hypothetical protein
VNAAPWNQVRLSRSGNDRRSRLSRQSAGHMVFPVACGRR